MNLEEYRQINSGDMEWKKNVDNQELYHLIFAFFIDGAITGKKCFYE